MEKRIAHDMLLHSVTVMPDHEGKPMWELDAEVPWANATVLAILGALYPGWVNEPLDNLFCEEWGDNPDDTCGTTALDMATRTYTLAMLVGKEARPAELSLVLASHLKTLFNFPSPFNGV